MALRPCWTPAPMPRFVDDAVRIVAWVAHPETMPGRVPLQPGECRRGFEACLGRRIAGRADVQRQAAVVFAETGCRVDLQYVRDTLAARTLALENSQLVVVAAVTGNRIQG